MIRKATVEDANRIAEIHVQGWRFAYRGLVSDEFLFKQMEVVKRANGFKQVFAEEIEDTYVCEENGIIKGFMTIGNSRDEDKPKAFELWGIYVDPYMVRGGIGKKLLQYCEEKAVTSGYDEVILWVLEKNQIGTNFYEKSGYKPDGASKILERFGLKEIRYIKQL